jgi:hypothetical protein
VLYGHRAWPLEGNPFGVPVEGDAGAGIVHDGKRYVLIRVEDR